MITRPVLLHITVMKIIENEKKKYVYRETSIHVFMKLQFKLQITIYSKKTAIPDLQQTGIHGK